MPPKAILFDFDGVIADTDNHHIAAWQRTLAVMGWQVAEEVAARSAEIDDRDFLAQLFTHRGITGANIDEWVRRKQALAVQLLKDGPRLFPGVVDLVHSLQGRARLAVVSGTWRENIQAVLESAGLFGSFDTIVGREDVTGRKPAPDPYQLALKRLRLVARSTVALEDSPAGLAAARAAGIRPIAIGHRHLFGEWVGDATYVSGFEPAEGLLQHLGL
jgi:HAD superfamily hydrolase (TIGR01509 family)